MMSEHKEQIVFLRLMPPILVWGGLEKLMLEWFERIDHSQCKTTLIVSSSAGDLYRKHLDSRKIPVEVIEFEFRKDFRYVDGFWTRLKKLKLLLKTLNPAKVIFFQGSFMDFDLSHVLAAHQCAPGQVFMHENLGAPQPSAKSSKTYLGFIPGVALWWYAEKYLTPLRGQFSQVYVVSAEIKQRMVELWRYPAEKVEVLYHGVDVQRFRPSEETREKIRRDMGIASSDTVMIVAARLSQEKCIDRAINAFDELSLEFPDIRLMIAGTGPYEERLKTLASEKRSKEKIRFLGHVTNVDELYQMSDIYILSSDNEGLSLAFLEAMASGLVCVVTRCTGTTEVIEDGKNGFLVEKSFEGVYSGLRKAIKLYPEVRSSVSENAKEFVNAHFEINRNVQNALKKIGLPLRVSK